MKQPKRLLGKLRPRLRRGGRLVIHEYFDYRTWRLAPRFEPFEEFVADVMASWRDAGGEPDAGLHLPGWLPEEGFRVDRLRPIVHFATPRDFLWQWPAAFIETGLDRLLELGHTTAERARAVRDEIAARERRGDALMVTPSVVEIVATAV